MLVLSSFVLLYGQEKEKSIKADKKEIKVEKVVSNKYKSLKSYTKYKASRLFYVSKRKRIKTV